MRTRAMNFWISTHARVRTATQAITAMWTSTNVQAIRVKTAVHAPTQSTDLPANAPMASVEPIAKRTSTTAIPTPAKTRERATMGSIHSPAHAPWALPVRPAPTT